MGEDREESKHKHRRHKKHSSSKKHAHRQKSEHKHRSSRHHRHGRSHNKRHKDKKKIDEATLQNALEKLEVLEDILKTSGNFSPEELMSQVLKEAAAGGSSGDDTEDSSSDSDDNLESHVVEQSGVEQDGKGLSTIGTGSSANSASTEELELTVPGELEKNSLPLASLKDTKEGEVMTKEAISPDLKQEKLESGANTDETSCKQPSSLAEPESDSSSNSEVAEKTKKAVTSSRKEGVFKPFSKKLGLKTEIKINIRQKEPDASNTVEQSEKEGGKVEENSSIKSDSQKEKTKNKASHERARGRESKRKKHRRSRTRSRTRSRSRSRSRHRHSRHSRSPRRHRSRSRSYSRSRRSRRGRSHSRSRRYRSKTRSHSRSRRYRSRNRSHSRSRRRRSRSRSHSHSQRHRSRSRSRSYSSSPPPVKRNKKSTDKSTKKKEKVEDKESPAAAPAGGEGTKNKMNQISQLTDFCKNLQAKQAHEDVYGETTEVQDAEIHHPFAVKPTQPSYFQQPSLVYHNNAWKTTNQLAIEASASQAAKPLVEKFPVSAGIQHTRENPSGADNVFAQYQELSKMSVTDLVAQRVQAQRQILINPADIVAHTTLNQIEQKTALWAESKVTPGQYTGQQKITPLSKEAHNTGYQAWAKKKMFRGLPPVGDGFGRKMLEKMGWREGQPIGKHGEGHIEPICLDVKLDRSGLTTESDWKSKGGGVQPASVLKGTKADARSLSIVLGKHPVSALQELCARKRWDPPHYELKEDMGPSHLKSFMYQVSTPLGTFQPAVGSNTKKVAKMQAATAALQGLGLIEKTIEYTSA